MNIEAAQINLKSRLNPGLVVDSRKDNPSELAELSNFVFLLDAAGLSVCSDHIFYDSGCSMCTWEYKPMPALIKYLIGCQVDELAMISISQFEDSHGLTIYGAPMI
ncbi:hypothetical protein [Desulfocicer niacini]